MLKDLNLKIIIAALKELVDLDLNYIHICMLILRLQPTVNYHSLA